MNYISAYKLEPVIITAKPISWQTDLTNCICVKAQESNEEKYKKEVEHKIKLEFNDYLYENYYKRGKKISDYTKTRLYGNFKFDKTKKSNKFYTYLQNQWEKFEDKYL